MAAACGRGLVACVTTNWLLVAGPVAACLAAAGLLAAGPANPVESAKSVELIGPTKSARPAAPATSPEPPAGLTIQWDNNFLTIRGPQIPGGSVSVLYLEAYCRPGSADRDWRETVIGHKTERVEAAADGRSLRLRCVLADGVRVDHEIRAGTDEVSFRLTAHNPTDRPSQAHWAQPCIRVDKFTGRKQDDYLNKCFIILDGQLVRFPTPDWAVKARYTPGQVWRPRHVDPADVNPRPLNPRVVDCGLIGCFSADEKMILATAWEPYQELFQGVIVCIHSDFRIGGLQPKQTKTIRGKIYIVPADVPALLRRYERDFPEHRPGGKGPSPQP